MTSEDPFSSQSYDEVEDEVAEEEDSMNETRPEEPSALHTRTSSEPAMLSPPLSPPSPAAPSTHPKNDASDTSETSSRSAAFDATLSKSLEEYISKLTQDDILGQPRFDEVLQDIWRSSGVWMDPKELKQVVLRNTRQRYLDQWKDDPVISSENEVLVSYQRRLMIHDIDNQLRLLDVPL